jgi:hypothetical protein
MAERPPTPIRTLADVLRESEPRPQPGPEKVRGEKNTYSTRFANNMARLVAFGLREQFGDFFSGILPHDEGGLESAAWGSRGTGRLDVNYSTPELGLGLGISLKSVHIPEEKSGRARRYTHNMKRNDEELRVESISYHTRQPYAVMVAVLFLPYDSCSDGTDVSSFGAWVEYLHELVGRKDPGDDAALFERGFIGLYDPDPSTNRMEFFDIEQPPPRKGRPQRLLPFSGFLGEIKKSYDRRNHKDFKWSEEVPLDEVPPPYGEPS